MRFADRATEGKYLSLLRKSIHRISAGTFSQQDVLALFVLARDQSAKNSAIRELGNFIVHRENRDQGPFYTYLSDSQRSFREKDSGGPPFTHADFQRGIFSENPVFALNQIEQELRVLSDKITLEPLEGERVSIIVLMLISILQGSVFKGICRLMVVVTDKEIGLVGTVEDQSGWGLIPVLSVPNKWYQVPPAPQFIGLLPDEELEVECTQGRVILRGLHANGAV